MAHSSKGRNILSNAKPFCECKQCSNKKCPNVLQKLGVTLKDKPSSKGKRVVPTVAKNKQVTNKPEEPEQTPSLLGILNPERTCNCDVVAKALYSDIHMNIGTLIKRQHNNENPSHSKDSDNLE